MRSDRETDTLFLSRSPKQSRRCTAETTPARPVRRRTAFLARTISLAAFARTVNADVFTSAVIEQERDMTADMISVSRCIALSGLGNDEIVLGVTRARRHDDSTRTIFVISGRDAPRCVTGLSATSAHH